MIPNGWQIQDLADVALIILGQSPPSSACNDKVKGYPFYQGNADFGYRHPLPQNWIEKPLKVAKKDDILISVRAPVGELNIANTDCCIGRGVGAIRPLSVNRNFIYYTLLNARNSLASVSQGSTFDAINGKELRSLSLLIPPFPEQKKIAAILSSVDDAIQATQAVIDQTRRVKQGLLQQLLTRGIGHTRFKQTEIGDIPEEWETGFLNRFCEQICVGFVGTCEKYYRNTGIPMIRTGNLKEGFLDSSKMKYVTHDFHQKQKKSQLKPGDLLIARHGKHGQACLVPESLSEANCLNVVIVRVNKDHFNPLFLQYLFNSNLIRQSIESKSAGSTQTVINTSEIALTLFPKPSLHEQIEIAEIIKTVDHSIDLDGDKLHSLYVIKRGLMQDLLTGRVRVKPDGEATT